jgi:propanediol dehydratase large subunit
VQDIADTVRASFPYVQVAARHGMTPAKIAELLSRMLVSPPML